jgi:WD40 repeat protein
VWDAAKGDLLLTIGFGSWPYIAKWSADGTRLIVVSVDRVGSVWDATTGERLVTFIGENTPHEEMSLSPGGDRIVTGGMDSTARVWDINTGGELASHSVGGMLFAADWSPDGTRVVVASSDGTATVLPAWQTTQDLIDYAKECCVIRELTAEERELFGLAPR